LFDDNSYNSVIAKSSFVVEENNILNVSDFGAVCDGVTDDTAAINAALVEAAKSKKALKFDKKGTCLVSNKLVVTNGITQIFGGKIKFTGKITGIRLEGVVHGLAENVKDLRIHHMNIETNGYGILGYNNSRVKIHNNVIRNKKSVCSIYLFAHNLGAEDAVDNVISYNKISGQKNWGGGVYIISGLDYKYPSDANFGAATVLWFKEKTNASLTYAVRNTTITHNTIDGSYYGMYLSGAQNTLVSENTTINNTVSFTLSNGSNNNRIINNTLKEMVSSAVNLAYGSSDNLIRGNNISSSVATGEGLLQAYVGAKRNLFEKNAVESTGIYGPKWMLYLAVHADGNNVRNNIFTGSYGRACIAIEPAWDETQLFFAHRGSYLTKTYKHHVWANQDSDLIVIKDNILDVHSWREGAPEIFYSQITDDLGVHRLTNLVIENNTIVNPKPNYAEPYFLED